jgi:predicted dehydrogenase
MASTDSDTAKLRTAIIGMGSVGFAHFHALEESGRFDVVIACDTDQIALDYVHLSEPELDMTKDWRRLLDRPHGIEVVVITAPHTLYADMVPDLLGAGLHILVEKPFGRNIEDAVTMANAATLSNRVLMVGGQIKHNSTFRRARRILTDQLLGQVLLSRAVHTFRRPATQEWGWRGTRKESGGMAVLSVGWQVLDPLIALQGIPTKVYATGGSGTALPDGNYDVDDRAVITMDYADGSIGYVLASFAISPYEWRVAFHGTEGCLDLQPQQITLDLGEGPSDIERVTDTDTMVAQADHFANAILRNIPPISGAAHGVAVMSVVDAAYRSMKSGSSESIET